MFLIVWLIFSVPLVYVSFEAGKPLGSLFAFVILLIPILIYCFAFLLPTLVHEVGHAIGGIIGGLVLQQFFIGPLKWQKEGKRFRFNFDRTNQRGLTVMAPRPGSKWTYKSIILLLVGGPIASLICGVVATIVFFYRGGMTSMSDTVGFLILFIGITQFWMCAASFGLQKQSEGVIMGSAIFKGRQWIEKYLLSALIISNSHGQRPREWDKWAVDMQASIDDTPMHVLLGNRTAFWRHLDLGETEEAKKHIDIALSVTNPNLPEQLAWAEWDTIIEGAYFYAEFQRDEKRSTEFLSRARNFPVNDKGTARRALIAHGIVTGTVKDPQMRIRRAIAKLDLDKGTDVVEKDLLESMLSRLGS